MKSRKTVGLYSDVIALTRAFNRQDKEAYLALFPKSLEETQAMLSVAIDILNGVTRSPVQETIFEELLKEVQAQDLGMFPGSEP